MNLSYIEISKSALIHNIHQFRNFISKKTQIMTVVKANAYGHGIAQIVPLVEPYTDYFAIDDLEELRELRKYTNKPILIMGYIAKENLEEVVSLKGEPVMYDLERAKILNQIGQKQKKSVKIHIKIDASLGRQGMRLPDIQEFVEKLGHHKELEIISAYAHFANIEDIPDPQEEALEFSHAKKQIDEYKKAVKIIMKKYPNIKTHISSTAGTMVYEQNHHHNDFVRIGIGVYGLWPSKTLQKIMQHKLDLKPVLTWKSHIAQVKTLPPNEPIGYGLTYMTNKQTKIAIIPQGYSDGYDRGLSNKGKVLIHGKKCPIVGRVMMNMIVVDVTEITNLQPQDEVVLLGTQNTETISAQDIADLIETINYEIVARINPLILREVKE